MADKIPVKAIYSGSDVTSLGEYASSDKIASTYLNTGTGSTDVALGNHAHSGVYAETTADQSWTGSQRATAVVDNDGSFDLNLGQNFICTVSTGTITVTFTNIPNGQSGFIKLINSGATMAAFTGTGATKVDAALMTTISTAGTYLLSYFSDGTDVWLTTSAIYT